MLQISHHNTETNTCTIINTSTQIFWTISPRKNPMWGNQCSKGGFYYSTILQYNWVPNWLTHREIILQHFPILSVSLVDLCIAPRPSVSAPASLRQHWASLRHPRRPSSDCAVCCLCVCLSNLCAGLLVLFPTLCFVLLPPATLQTTSSNFSANPAPEIELTGLPQYISH